VSLPRVFENRLPSTLVCWLPVWECSLPRFEFPSLASQGSTLSLCRAVTLPQHFDLLFGLSVSQICVIQVSKFPGSKAHIFDGKHKFDSCCLDTKPNKAPCLRLLLGLRLLDKELVLRVLRNLWLSTSISTTFDTDNALRCHPLPKSATWRRPQRKMHKQC
jgi:hypothetical protein